MLSARRNLFASSSFRLAAIYSLLFVVSFMLAAAGAWSTTQAVEEREIRERVQAEMNSLTEEIQLEGMPAAISAIRTRANTPGALEYRLSDANEHLLFGDFPIAHPTAGWRFLDLRDASSSSSYHNSDFISLTERLPSGALLTIAGDLEYVDSVRVAVLSSIFWVGLLALLLALFAGAVATIGGLRRMEALGATMDRVSVGDLSARAPARVRGGDDIDSVGRGVNEMLDHINLLVANVRRVSTDIAHDMRTPLAHVRQELESAAGAGDVDTAHAAVRRAQAKIDDVLRMFSAMLRLAEIESGSVRARFSSVDLAAVVERVIDAYRPDIESSGRTLHCEALTAASVPGDADLIAQALGNLLENAMRHAPAGAAVTVRLVRDTAHLRLEIEDHGPGIPEGDRARVLSPFVRLENSRSTPGAGLGLSIVNAVAQLHRAAFKLEDANPGLRAVLEWPA